VVTAVVIGVGNSDRADDGAGPRVAERVRSRAPRGVEVLTSLGDPMLLIEAWSEVDAAIVIDALVPGGRPGRVIRLDALSGPLPAALFARSTHELGVAQAVELARALGVLPPRLIIFGIEGRRFDAFGPVSPEVARAVRRVSEDVIDSLGDANASRPVRPPSAC
jgi:hydrogenase maturation protease